MPRCPRPARLKRRSEFLRAAKHGRKWATPGLVLQAYRRQDDEDPGRASDRPCVGFTASRKVGSAVRRNRARRRLRSVADALLPVAGAPDTDYVLIARAGTLTRAYGELLDDLKAALRHVEATNPARADQGRRRAAPRQRRRP